MCTVGTNARERQSAPPCLPQQTGIGVRARLCSCLPACLPARLVYLVLCWCALYNVHKVMTQNMVQPSPPPSAVPVFGVYLIISTHARVP